jgi:beta-lactamase class C
MVISGFVVHRHYGMNPTVLKSEGSSIARYNPVDEIKPLLIPYDSIVEQFLEGKGTVGAAIVISYKGRTAFTKCFGVKEVGGKDSIDKHTVFRLASVSKTLTGVLASIMDDENMINLDDKIIDYLPDFQLKETESTRQLTVKNVLSQTSGVIPHAFDLMAEDKIPLNKIISHLKEADLTAPPGQIYTYQNVVFSLYEPVVEAKTHQHFQQVMNDKVFKPFGMDDASLDFQTFCKNRNKAHPHTGIDENQFEEIPLNDRYYNTAPAAGVNASISDMGNFLSVLTRHDSTVFSHNAFKTVFCPQVKTPLNRSYFSTWGQDISDKEYAIGWRIVNYKGHKIAYHGGYVKGYNAEIALCNYNKIGIAILCNSPNNNTFKCIPAFLNMFFDYIKKNINTEEVRNAIVDLRFNSGGDYTKLTKMSKALPKK